MNQKKIVNIILIVAIFSVIGGLGYFVLKNKIATLNWKMYRNEQYAFEIKYPPGVNFKECDIPDIHVVSFDYDSHRTCAVDGRFIISVFSSSLVSLNDLINLTTFRLDDPIKTESIIGQKKFTTLRGVLKEKEFGDFIGVYNFIILNENGYEISFITETNKDPSYYADVFNKMVSTFKFIR